MNDTTFEAKKSSLLKKLGLVDEAQRIHLAAFSWSRLESLVVAVPNLQRLFIHQERPADKFVTERLRQLVARIVQLTKSKLLFTAWEELHAYVKLEKPEAADKFHWVPSELFDPLVDLFLAAGDFCNAEQLLNTALGTNPLNASYLLGYLRAKRVLHAAPRHNRLTANLFETPPAPRPVADEIVAMAEQLLRARGATDAQLTLALWVVSYAPTQALAEDGLRRGLGLVTQAWPDNVDRLERSAWYTLTAEGYLVKQPDPLAFRPPASNAHLRACALATAYMYIRAMYAARFGADPLARVEHAHEGWPQDIEDITGYAPFRFFAEMAPLCKQAMQTHLPSLYAEGSGREFHWQPSDHPVFPFAPQLDRSSYVASPEFLLRDCVNGLVERRIEEFNRAGWMGDGATLVISHLGLERLAQTQLGNAMGFDTQGMSGRAAGAVATNISTVLARLVRHESWPNYQYPNARPVFASQHCFANFGENRQGHSLDASLALSRRHSMPFLATSTSELDLADRELLPTQKRFTYWTPTRPTFAL